MDNLILHSFPVTIDSLLLYVPTAALGVVSHLAIFRRGEWHLKAPRLALLCLLAPPILFVSGMIAGLGLERALWAATALCIVFFGSMFASITVYRIYLHPLRHFKGPRLAGITKIWHSLYCVKGQNHLLLGKMHEVYGDFVRTGPNELTIFDPKIVPLMYEGINNCFTKPDFYDNLHPLVSVNAVRDRAFHGQRRRAWNSAFTSKALKDYEGRLRISASQLEQQIGKTTGQPMDIGQQFYWFGFDVMGELTFSHSFGMLRRQEWHHAISLLRRAMGMLGASTAVPWLAHIGSALPVLGISRDFNAMLDWASQRMDERIENDSEHPDIAFHLIEASKKNGTLQRDLYMLHGDAFAAIVAGSDTVASALIYALYHLTQRPQYCQELRTQLQQLDSIIDFKQLEQCRILNAIIQEVLRLHPPIPTAGLRAAPPEGVTVSGVFIPEKTTICAPQYILGRMERCFVKPNEFIPERWYSKPELIRDKTAYAPFSLGRTSCIGKNLAKMELRLVLALLVSRYDFAFAPGEDGLRTIEDAKDQFTNVPGKLELVFKACERD